jgi:hypothetical protein
MAGTTLIPSVTRGRNVPNLHPEVVTDNEVTSVAVAAAGAMAEAEWNVETVEAVGEVMVVAEGVVETAEVGAEVNLVVKTGGASEGKIDLTMTTADVRTAVVDEVADSRIALGLLESQELPMINESICKLWREQDLFIYMVWRHA